MDKVRVAMVGCGGFQRYRAGNLAKVKEAEIVALVDPSAEQMQMFREQHPVTQAVPGFDDHKKMLDEIKPDAIMIATPHTQHVGQILDGLAAGANVCCEKPLITSVADAHRVIAARDAAKKVGMVSYQRHFQPEYRYIREKIQSGESGKVQFIAALQGQGWLRGTKGSWRQQHSLSGGGQLNDSGSHLIDIILWSTGVSAASVSAYGDNFGTEVDINSALTMRYQNGALGTFSVVGNGFGWHEDVTIFCEEQVFYVREGKLTIVDRSDNRFKAEHLGGGSTPDKNFIDACRGVAECESPFECGLEVIRLTEAAWQSMERDGAPVAVTA
ncbi:Gfo/Idh/MocA family protein [Fimbriimonas ginsengisoli]|uniref:Oxidoreductase domain protein n=1 Tax=Fimbriimonas ginsengisoli Gsoil 348 TaxID=661478 RepID=A0A068NSI4_FIMGI|nr:Gfo/Idh/MocA family oxidoreductase [Fimbriimonas ginsengisoli]AIE84539.1 oxidoreductase domain protein [Fimbriimonas ginsengisoli Gsoil 348]